MELQRPRQNDYQTLIDACAQEEPKAVATKQRLSLPDVVTFSLSSPIHRWLKCHAAPLHRPKCASARPGHVFQQAVAVEAIEAVLENIAASPGHAFRQAAAVEAIQAVLADRLQYLAGLLDDPI